MFVLFLSQGPTLDSEDEEDDRTTTAPASGATLMPSEDVTTSPGYQNRRRMSMVAATKVPVLDLNPKVGIFLDAGFFPCHVLLLRAGVDLCRTSAVALFEGTFGRSTSCGRRALLIVHIHNQKHLTEVYLEHSPSPMYTCHICDSVYG